MTIIKVENLGKKYLIGHEKRSEGAFRYNSMRDSIVHSMRGIYQRIRHPLSPNKEKIEMEEFWALKDINFEIKQGDRVGIIGHNGAGKTTLLKLLSRITQPTTGSIKIKGRIASLLEVGTGFHPELSGRENIYLNGSILGMKRIEIKKKFDEIIAFAEVEKFLDTPVKRYSSGMYVRLAFAVAAHLEPEILLVDEVLAVGDAAFQKKSLGKMEAVSKEGRTVLFVSHNMLAIKKLCNRSMLLKNGNISSMGNTTDVIENYKNLFSELKTKDNWRNNDFNCRNDSIYIKNIEIVKDRSSEYITVWTPFEININFLVLKPGLKLNFVIRLFNSENILVFNSSSFFEKKWHGKSFPIGFFRSICTIPEKLLNVGHYYINVSFINDTSKIILQCERAIYFEVIEKEEARPGNWHGKYPGIVRPLLKWETELLEGK